MTKLKRYWALALVLEGGLILLPLLGLGPVFQVSEGREGVVVNEILSGGDWILPLRNGEIVPSKPILFHWISAALATAAGFYDEFMLRLPSVLSALGTVLVVFLLVLEFGGLNAGVIAGLLLLSTYGFLHLAQDGRVDMLFCLLLTAAIAEWLKGAARTRKEGKRLLDIPSNVYLKTALFTGLSVLAKGPLGLVGVALVIGPILFWESRFRGLRSAIRWQWIFAFLLPAPWYIASTLRQAAFAKRQLIFENLERFVGGEGITIKPPWFYLPHFILHPLPWSLLFIGYTVLLGVDAWRRRRERRGTNQYLPTDPLARFGIKSALIWCFSLFLFFSISAGKRRAYLLLVVPPIAMALSLRFMATWERLQRERKIKGLQIFLRYEGFTWGALVWLVAVVLGFAAYKMNIDALEPILKRSPDLHLSLLSLREAVVMSRGLIPAQFVFLSLLTIGLWTYGFWKKQVIAVLFSIFLFVQFIITVYADTAVAAKGLTHTYKDFAAYLAETVPQETKLHFVKKIKDESFDGLFFYYRRHVKMIDPEEIPAEPGLYVARRRWINLQPKPIKSRIHEIKTGGRRTDTPEEKLVLFQLM